MSSDKYHSDLLNTDYSLIKEIEYLIHGFQFPHPVPLRREHNNSIPEHLYDLKLLDVEYHNTFNNDYNIFLKYYDSLLMQDNYIDYRYRNDHFRNAVCFKIVCLIKVINGEYDNIPDNYRIIDLIFNDPDIKEYLNNNIYRILCNGINTVNELSEVYYTMLYGDSTNINTFNRYPLILLERVFLKSPDYKLYNNIKITDNKLLYTLLYTDDNFAKLELLLNNPNLNIDNFIDTKVCKFLVLKNTNIKNIDRVRDLIFSFGLNSINIIILIDFIITQNYKKYDLINEILRFYKRCLTDNEVINICSKILNNDQEILVYNKTKHRFIQEKLLDERLSYLKPATFKKIMSGDLITKIQGAKLNKPVVELTKQFLRIDNKSKYLKYKNKYLNLKGGNPSINSQEKILLSSESSLSTDTFYVYTTGINDDVRLIDMWFDILCNSVLSCIPKNFGKIVIEHYDPVELKLGSATNIRQELIIRLKRSDQVFIPKELPIKNLKNPHIVIDMAHIFGYYPNEENKYDAYWSGYYDHGYTKDTHTTLGIKSIYIGFDRTDIAKCKLFKVTPDGKVRTFIDNLIDLGLLPLESQYIENNIDNLVKKLIKRKLENLWRDNCKYVFELDDLLFRYEIVCSLINKIINGATIEELEDITSYEFYKDFQKELSK